MAEELIEKAQLSAKNRETETNLLKAHDARAREEQINRDSRDLSGVYSKLSPEQRSDFLLAQQIAAKEMERVIQGGVDLAGFNSAEREVVTKIQKLYRESKEQNPQDPFKFDSVDPMDRQIYYNIIQKIALYEKLPDIQRENDQKEVKKIEQDLEILKQLEILNSISDRDIQNFLREVSSETLAAALKGASEQARQKIYKNMSIRGAEMLKEYVDSSTATSAEVKKAQTEILKKLQSK